MYARTVAVSPGMSHKTTKQYCQYTTLVDIQNSAIKRMATQKSTIKGESSIQNHIGHGCNESAQEQRIVLYKSNQ